MDCPIDRIEALNAKWLLNSLKLGDLFHDGFSDALQRAHDRAAQRDDFVASFASEMKRIAERYDLGQLWIPKSLDRD
jgi:hypothetical protein